jgi:hypothetical protein
MEPKGKGQQLVWMMGILRSGSKLSGFTNREIIIYAYRHLDTMG